MNKLITYIRSRQSAIFRNALAVQYRQAVTFPNTLAIWYRQSAIFPNAFAVRYRQAVTFPNDLVSLESKIAINKIYLFFVAIFIFVSSITMAEEPIILRTDVVTQGDIWRGQRIVINIDVLGSAGWAQIKSMREPEIPGMYLIKTETQGTRLSETIGGTSYTGQRYEFSLFPQRAGKLIIPAIPVDIEIKTWGSDAENNISRKETAPLTIMVKEPPDAGNIKELISTSLLTVKQSWEPEPENLKVGDAFKRVITITAADVSGMVFPPLTWDKLTILDIYPGAAEVNDKIEDNIILGSRIETATYICQHEGVVTLPPITVTWWNLDKEKLVKEELPALTVNVKANSKIATNRNVFSNRRNNAQAIWTVALIILAVVILFIWGYMHYQIIIRQRLNAIAQRRRNSEQAYFKRFIASCKTSDNRVTYNDLQAWLSRVDKVWKGQINIFTGEYCNKQFKDQVDLLWNAIETGKEFDKTALLESAKQARVEWKKHSRIIDKADNSLPPLNPSS